MEASNDKIDKCGICHKQVKQGVEYDKCEIWFHVGCQKIPKDIYDILRRFEDQPGLMWFCQKCGPNIRRAEEKIREVENQKELGNKKIMELEHHNETLGRKISFMILTL